jgi:Nif-specific regulatory protein
MIESMHLISEFADALQNFDPSDHLLDDLLDILRRGGFEYVALKVADRETGELILSGASGLSTEERERGRYKFGEGITGQVAETGKALVIPDIQTDERFLHRMRNPDQKGCFFCFPILLRKNVVAVLSALSTSTDLNTLKQQESLIRIVTPIISQSIRFLEQIEQERQRFHLESTELLSQLREKRASHRLIGRSSKMQEIYEQIHQVAGSNATVLIIGANGTGKELVADAIHHSSPRANKPLIKVNCAALPENLLESELFGHEKGAFTGAFQTKKGRVEAAEGGTLFLDEIGEMPLSLQSKLLRFLQNREFERVGGLQTFHSNIRIIAATNRNLTEEVRKGGFREDLYYRLNVFPIFIPSLAERKTDILLLAEFFLEKYAAENNKEMNRISTPAIDLLLSYHWPGNVRELENCIERAVLVAKDGTIRGQDLPPSLQISGSTKTGQLDDHWSMPDAVANLEKEMIIEALKKFQGHQGKAASWLGVTERQMGYKMKNYKITKTVVYSG